MRLILVFVCFLLMQLAQTSAHAQKIISALSTQEVQIDSNFSGETLTLFGNVEPDTGELQRLVDGPYDVVVTIQGPAVTHTLREKHRKLGIWLNDGGKVFAGTPSYYQILSSREVENIADAEVISALGISLAAQVENGRGLDPGDQEAFDNLQRLLQEADLYGQDERAISFLSPTFYRAQIDLPANVPNGSFLAKTYLFSKGEPVHQRAVRFLVQTTGVERILERSAADQPLIYGLVCVVLALFTGWIGSVAFRR